MYFRTLSYGIIIPMAKSQLRLEARALRRNGLGIKTIAQKLNISSSTASLWCRDIELTPVQLKQLSKNAHDPYYGKRAANIAKQKRLREERIKRFFQQGIREVGKLDRQGLFLSGIALYWAEGFKKDNLAGFSNSDPAMVRFFIHWLETCCGIKHKDLRLRLGVNEQCRDKVDTIERFWSIELKISRKQFQKPFFQKVQWKKLYDNPEEYHGVLRVRIAKSTNLLRKINGWIEGLRRNM